jgi:hypothetical protein
MRFLGEDSRGARRGRRDRIIITIFFPLKKKEEERVIKKQRAYYMCIKIYKNTLPPLDLPQPVQDSAAGVQVKRAPRQQTSARLAHGQWSVHSCSPVTIFDKHQYSCSKEPFFSSFFFGKEGTARKKHLPS